MNVKVKEEKSGTCVFLIETFDSISVIFFQNFNYPATYVYAAGDNDHS